MIVIFGGSFALIIEKLLTYIPSLVIMAKVIPPGVEGIMTSVSMTLINLNQYTLRQTLGARINSNVVHVTYDHMEKYYILTIVEFIFKIFPLLYIHCLLPTNESV